jgi:gliding motility-associated-like protein
MITPNVITPNGDNVNDVLYIQSLKPNTAISILNRWGVVVYSSVNYLNDWNGKDDKGDDLTDGVYTVMLTEIGNLQSYFFIHLIR